MIRTRHPLNLRCHVVTRHPLSCFSLFTPTPHTHTHARVRTRKGVPVTRHHASPVTRGNL